MSCGSASEQYAEFFAQFGTKSLAILGFSPQELGFNTKESNRQNDLANLQDEYQNTINDAMLAYAQLTNEQWTNLNDDFQAYIQTSYQVMNNSNLTLTNQLKSQQIFLIGIYLLFFIVYFYLIFFT
jgi:hypothetical protein